jgi:catechol 2,3-dioxygenase-like lactoylglutathione lyase family enzyme
MINQEISAAITFLRTNDLDRTADFYTRSLGFPLTLDQGTCRIFRIRPGAYLGFCVQDEPPETKGIIFTLVVEDVDGVCASLEAAGVPIEVQPRFNEGYQIYQCFARDPNGYLIEIQRFEDPRWRGDA